MRQYIFSFKQELATKHNLNLNELLILDYLIKFFNSGTAKCGNFGGIKYYWITYDKILSDLPILNIKERALAVILSNLEKKNIVSKKLDNKKIYININEELLFNENNVCESHLTKDDEEKLHQLANKNLNDSISLGEKNENFVLNYYKNQIKVLVNNQFLTKIHKVDFLGELKQELKNILRPLTYDICIKNMEIETLNDNFIILLCPSCILLEKMYITSFYDCLKKVLNKYLNMAKRWYEQKNTFYNQRQVLCN